MNKAPHHYYWLILDHYVHVSHKGNRVILYNPLNGKILEYTDNETVIGLVKRLHAPANLLVIRLSEGERAEPEISRFIEELRQNYMGDLIDATRVKGKPMQMMPCIKIQKDIEAIKKDPFRSVGTTMMKYLSELSLYINGTCSLDCHLCGSAYKQFLFCTRTPNCRGSRGKEELTVQSVENLFRQLSGSALSRVNILGGNPLDYPDLDRLISILDNHPRPLEKVFYMHYLNLADLDSEPNILSAAGCSFKILVNFPLRRDRWKKMMASLPFRDGKVEFLFIIENNSQLGEVEAISTAFGLDQFMLHPYFNGGNYDFFQQNVFPDKTDLRDARPTMREILARQIVNPFNFGRLTILDNGHIHANVNEPRLGILEKDSIYEVLFREMYRGRSWRRIRKRVEPCKNCMFEVLCPPLSNYEYALGRHNLCRIWK